MRKLVAFILALLLALSCVGCGGGDKSQDAAPAETDAPAQAESGSVTGTLEGFPWTVELRGADVRDSLYTQAGLRQYDGSIMNVDYSDSPSDGHVFLILTLTISKTAAGGSQFAWDKLTVADGDGNTYSRMENDTFLQNHQYNRMASTPLQIGEHKGSVCFEVPADKAEGPFTLQYDVGDAGMLTLPVDPS